MDTIYFIWGRALIWFCASSSYIFLVPKEMFRWLQNARCICAMSEKKMFRWLWNTHACACCAMQMNCQQKQAPVWLTHRARSPQGQWKELLRASLLEYSKLCKRQKGNSESFYLPTRLQSNIVKSHLGYVPFVTSGLQRPVSSVNHTQKNAHRQKCKRKYWWSRALS